MISIIIPTHSRPEALARTLTSLAGIKSSAAPFEVLVIDNGAPEQTREAFQSIHSSANKQQWRYVHDPMPGLLTGRHRGIKEARGDILAFLDDDVRIGPNWLDAIVEGFSDQNVCLMGGPCRPLYESPPPDWLEGFFREYDGVRGCSWLSLIDAGKQIRLIDPCLVYGLNFVIRRRTVEDLGGFHPDSLPKALQRFQGDGETGLSAKIKSAGKEALYHPEAMVEHEVPSERMTPEYFNRRAYYQGVCDSYTWVRKNGLRPKEVPQQPRQNPLRRLYHYLRSLVPSPTNRIQAIVRGTRTYYAKGYAFHQAEVTKDPSLLAWVQKETYWDYQLPSGWEAHLFTINP